MNLLERLQTVDRLFTGSTTMVNFKKAAVKDNSVELENVPGVSRQDVVDFKPQPEHAEEREFDAAKEVRSCFGLMWHDDIPAVMYTSLYDPGNEFTFDDLAELAGLAGKRIDKLHEHGYYSDDQYAQLNTELENYTKHLADTLSGWKAAKRWRDERVALHAKYGPSYWKMQSSEERELDRLQFIKEYREQNPPDYDSIFSMMNQFRYGSANPAATVTNLGDQA